MTSKPCLLILDIDGVLITSPPWKPDELHLDGYSQFNRDCVENLNDLLKTNVFEMYLSSTRRTVKTINEFNRIFRNRGIIQNLKGFVPEYPKAKNRREEIEYFLKEFNPKNYLILDDDKSLNDSKVEMKNRLVLTELQIGFTKEKLTEALNLIGL